MDGDSLQQGLAARLVGSGQCQTGVAALDAALTLQFRAQYHLFGAGMTGVVAQVLLDECDRLERGEPVVQKVVANLRAVLCFHLGERDESQRLLETAKAVSLEPRYRGLDTYLQLENLYYRGRCSGSVAPYTAELLGIVETIPSESQGLTLHYLYAILEQLGGDGLPDSAPVGLLARHIAGKISEKQLLKLATGILESATFPSAQECNDPRLEAFHAFLAHYFKSQTRVSPDWHSFITSSMQRTFQSVYVAKTAMFYFASAANVRESILGFINYARYAEKHYVISGGHYEDVVSLIECYTFVLGMASDESWNIENVFNVQETTEKLLKLLQYFYDQYNFPLMENSESLNWLENSSKLFLPRTISQTLSQAWETLYNVRSGSLTHLMSNDLACYLSNAMCAAPKGKNLVNLQFQYAFVLASQRHLEPAIKILKTVLLEANPECYKAWHLLALCESIHENKEVSFKIVCSVLEAMRESLNEKKLQITDRWQFVQLKLTQLSLIEELFGTLDASELLPEVFELYSTLFPSDTDEFDRIGDQCKQTKEYLLQAIWVFAANLYMRLGDRSADAKKAIKEATEVTDQFKNLNCDIASGFLKLVNGNARSALTDFETVLFYDPLNVTALVGLAEIVFPEELNESEKTLREYWHLKESSPRVSKPNDTKHDVFLSELDKSAACARLKFLLEYAITKSVDAYHSPEVWWYLSSIYEKYEDQSYKDSLLNCVRYRESDPIRGFQFCNY